MEQINPNTAEFKDRTQYEHTCADSCLFLGVLVESRLFSHLVSQRNVTLSVLSAYFSLCVYLIVLFLIKVEVFLAFLLQQQGLNLRSNERNSVFSYHGNHTRLISGTKIPRLK